MAGRKGKNIVDYFPHYCNHGKTIYILEQKYKSDGYTAWFKVLEKLGSNENHYIDCRNDADWEFLQASIPLIQTELSNILDLLAKLKAIHPELWEKKIIWSGKFIQNIEDAYKRRNDLCMHFDDLCKHLSIKCKHEYDIYGIIVSKKEQSKVEYSKENKSKEDIYREITENYKKYCPDMPEIKILTDQRKKAINARIKEHGKETIKQVLEIAGRSDFLNGGNDKKWKANFDWIMKPLNFVKIMEGNYNNNKQHDLSTIDWDKEERGD